ncbi:hypothetical protein [Sinisalibacter aestuarii]|uniref:Uncharacterized protein n=1 Tax=Sinisalibacter aestuarii TaxID=2949426 RepID=A0ABQ5LRG8_9RHOB|nr:hypothetical protein [Sinisalibacter aestuarii]GKY87600.1 hypothetical protein STA1M1_14690 [Sinisalibacter aestuarii]
MLAFVKRLWNAAPVATLLLAAALVACAYFGTRAVVFSLYWHDPAHREQEIAAWMTPGYIAHSWRVPREVVLGALGAPVPPPDGPMNLEDLAAYRGMSVEALIAEAEAAIAAFRADHPEGAPQ